MQNQFPPPPQLSDRSKALWSSVVPSRARSAARLAVIETALESLDRANQAAAEIATTGMTSVTKTTGAIHVHPLVKVERESRQLFAKLWISLNLQFTPSVDGVPLDKWERQQRGEPDELDEIERLLKHT